MSAPELTSSGNVRAQCPQCRSISSFEWKDGNSSHEYGHIQAASGLDGDGRVWGHLTYRLHRCAGCGRGGLSKVYSEKAGVKGGDRFMEWFFPTAIAAAALPPAVPPEIAAEFQEAEICASAGAWRAGSAMLRSVLEKTLKLNGYTTGSLQNKIDEASADAVLTDARKQRAHDEIRSLGNDVLHDAWRAVTAEEFTIAQHYAQRILEDFYDDRGAVEAVLIAKGRIQP